MNTLHIRRAAVLWAVIVSPVWAGPPLQLELTPQTRVTYQPKPWTPAQVLPQDMGRAPAQAALSLEFAGRSATRDVKSLLRVQLSADSVLNFRPRGGGLTVTYKSSF